jgi:hypothetical protein
VQAHADEPVTVAVGVEQVLGDARGGRGPLRSVAQSRREREGADREAVPAGDDLLVERRRAQSRPARGVEGVVEPFHALAVHRALAVLRAGKAAARDGERAEQEPGEPVGLLIEPREQLRVVDEHALVVRLGPVGAGRVAEEAAVHRVAQPGCRDRSHGAHAERLAAIDEEPKHGDDGELRRPAEAAVDGILPLLEPGDDRGEIMGKHRPLRPGRRERERELLSLRLDLGAPVPPGVVDRLEHLAKGRHARRRRRRPVGARVEGTAPWGDEHGQRPAEVRRESARRGEVGRIHFGVLLTVHLDGDETVVEPCREHRIAETLARHHVTPVTRGIADRHEHGDVASRGLSEGLRPPAPPVHRIAGVGPEVGARGVRETIGHASTLGGGLDDRPFGRSSTPSRFAANRD